MTTASALEIRLLGAVGAHRNGTPLRLGGDRQRRLLAFLALQPGRTRNADAIAASVWPDGDLPADPHQTIRTYVSRLRSSLGDVEAIALRDGGYRLCVDELAVDAFRFEALLRSVRSDGAPTATTLEVLDEALSLWGGPALEGYDLEDWARPDAVRLDELRAQAVDDRAQAQLDLGLHEEAVADLRAAVAERPLRDRAHRLLMTALERSGRQAEALRVFQDYRRRLATDLGLEVGDEIRLLEVSIARGAPGPAVTAQG